MTTGGGLGSALRDVAAGAPVGRWPPAAAVRDRADRRRADRWIGWAVLTAAALMVAAVLVPVLAGAAGTGGGGGARIVLVRHGASVEATASHTVAVPPTRAAGGTRLGSTEQGFALRILTALSAGRAGDVVVSPFSLTVALAMLELAARGGTARQIARVLGTSPLSAGAQTAGWGRVLSDLSGRSAGAGASLVGGRSIWTQLGLPLEPTYLAELRRWLGSGIWQVDFARHPAAALRALSAWVDHETRGRVPALLSPHDLRPDTAFVMADADSFDAGWRTRFAPTTTPGPFHTGSGPAVDVPYLSFPPHQPPELPAAEVAGSSVVELPYRGARYAAVVIVPPAGTSLHRFLSTFGGSRLTALLSRLRRVRVAVSLPSLHLSSALDLTPVLRRLGVADAFGPRADLSDLSHIPTRVAWIHQATALDVTPWGTRAAGASAVGGVLAAYRPQLTVRADRPFLFLVRDQATGTILFEAAVVRP